MANQMKFLVVTNTREQKGLLRDSNIVSALLLEAGHNVCVVDFRDEYFPKPVDTVIQLEVVEPKYFEASKKQWWIPNPDWAKPHCLANIDRFEHVLCKTRHAEKLFSGLSKKVHYIGFMSEDRYDSEVPREKLFFHAHRDSIVKGTDAILEAKGRCDFPLIEANGFSDEVMKHEQNRCLFHLQPSQSGGFEHTIHEGMSCGAIVVSTNVAPMNEFAGVAKLINPVVFEMLELAPKGIVNPEGVIEAIRWCQALGDNEIEDLSKNAREQYLLECKGFRERFGQLIGLETK